MNGSRNETDSRVVSAEKREWAREAGGAGTAVMRFQFSTSVVKSRNSLNSNYQATCGKSAKAIEQRKDEKDNTGNCVSRLFDSTTVRSPCRCTTWIGTVFPTHNRC
jgi:hypothetical protein